MASWILLESATGFSSSSSTSGTPSSRSMPVILPASLGCTAYTSGKSVSPSICLRSSGDEAAAAPSPPAAGAAEGSAASLLRASLVHLKERFASAPAPPATAAAGAAAGAPPPAG
eukprot:Mycagemm_TRINITY_DN10073_c0_g2::TRINITY_DN10073_c0_g2_i1::g.2262::m.2262 type:complete len:115 gc:universal TRINITY_DN10073_c0_g2_i1:1158-814(-)